MKNLNNFCLLSFVFCLFLSESAISLTPEIRNEILEKCFKDIKPIKEKEKRNSSGASGLHFIKKINEPDPYHIAVKKCMEIANRVFIVQFGPFEITTNDLSFASGNKFLNGFQPDPNDLNRAASLIFKKKRTDGIPEDQAKKEAIKEALLDFYSNPNTVLRLCKRLKDYISASDKMYFYIVKGGNCEQASTQMQVPSPSRPADAPVVSPVPPRPNATGAP